VTTVRPYEDRDQAAVIDACRTCFDEYGFTWETDGYCRDLYTIPATYQHEDAAFWVGEVDGEVVGCGGVLFFPLIPGPVGGIVDHEGDRRIGGTDCEIVRLYVHPKGRRNGVGTAIFEQVLSSARSRGCSRMEIWSDINLRDAHRLYERYGAVKIGQRTCPPPDQTPEFGMILGLAG
jgi:GNAT superfamily N-acetyltransferase